MSDDLNAQVLVVGGGPAGLAMAACLKQQGVDYVQIDRNGEIGGAYRTMYSATELLSPARYTQLPGLPIEASGEYVNAGQYFEYLNRYATKFELRVINATVDGISRKAHSGLEVRFRDHDPIQYAAVVLATGIVDHPLIPIIDGLNLRGDLPSVIHSRDWQGCEPVKNQRLLIVGGGMSGVEIAEQCAEAGLAVTISTRKSIRLWRRRVLNIDVHHFVHLISHALPRWIAGSYCSKLPALGAFDRGFRDFANAGKIRQRGAIRRFCEQEAEFETGETECFDMVVLATGYRWHPPCLPVDVKTGDAGHPIASRGKIVNYPGLYVIGAPCGRTLPSEFLHGVNHDAPAFAKSIVWALKRLKF